MKYQDTLHWILTNRAGMGGHPPRDPAKVAGWTATRLTAAIFNRTPVQVAQDLINLDTNP